MNSTITKAARYVLGLFMLVFGANHLFNFMPAPTPPPEAGAFLGALAGSGYIFEILGIVYVIVGLCLVVNKAVPFALAMLVPVSINVVAFHFAFDLAGIMFAAIVAVLNLLLIYAYWDRFKSLFD